MRGVTRVSNASSRTPSRATRSALHFAAAGIALYSQSNASERNRERLARSARRPGRPTPSCGPSSALGRGSRS